MFENSTLYDELLPWFMLLIASLGIFVWRFLGLILSSKIRKDSFFAKWINAIAFAMTTGLMVRIIFFPTGALAETELLERLILKLEALGVKVIDKEADSVPLC